MCRPMVCKAKPKTKLQRQQLGIRPTIAALHGGFSTLEFFHVEPSLPRTFHQPSHQPAPPSPNNAESLRQCIHKGWHTCRAIAWALNPQLIAGVPFLPHDEISSIGERPAFQYIHTFSITQAFGTMDLQKSTPS